MPEIKKIGVVGVGYMGKLHAQHFAANKRVKVVGVSDINKDRAQSVADEVGCMCYEDPEDLLGLVDAVSIAVPSIVHREIADLFLSRGIHMLMEKPLASSVEDAEHIVKQAKKHGVKLLVGHQERFNSAIMELTERISQPKYVEAHRQGKFAGRGGDVDVITDLMIHDIDLVLAIINSPVKSVSALGASVVTPYVDITNARLEFENGAVANVTASRVAEERMRMFQVYKQHQYLELDLLQQTVTLHTMMNGSEGNLQTHSEKIDTTPNLTLKTEINHFVDVLYNEINPFVTGEDALSALRVAEMVRNTVGHS